MKIKRVVANLGQTHWLFAAIALVIGCIFVFIVPPFWGLDEPAHFVRVYQITHVQKLFQSNFNIKSETVKGVPKNLVDLGNYSIGDLVDNNANGIFSRKDIDNVNGYKKFTDAKFSKEEVPPSSFATYSPVAYVGPIVGTLLAEAINANIGHTLLSARFFSLVLYITLGWLSIWVLRESKLKWLFMVILLLPTSLFQGSVISADGMLIGLSLLFTALFIRILKVDQSESSYKLLYAMTVIAIMLPLIKLNYIFLSAFILCIPTNVFINKKTANYIKWGGISIAVVLGLLWQVFVSMTSNLSASQRPDGLPINMASQIANIMHNPLDFIAACIRSVVVYGDSYIHNGITQVGWNYIDIPLMVLVVLCVTIFIAAIYARKELVPIRKTLLLVTVISLIGVISIFGILYAAFTPVGSKYVDGIQGRYFIPFLIPIMMTIACYIPFEIKMNKNTAMYTIGLATLSGLLFSVVYYYLCTY